nr:heme biosynthesis protein [Microheliella maris]
MIKNKKLLYTLLTILLIMIGLSYASVPLYRLFCQVTGYGGTTKKVGEELHKFETTKIQHNPTLTINFNSDIDSQLRWEFKPLQKEIKAKAGEPVLIFYSAKNMTDKPIIGISTYNVTPQKMGLYFNKIQCFCFEEQRLEPGESVDLPVFFFVDSSFLHDRSVKNITNLTLSYTFFNAEN